MSFFSKLRDRLTRSSSRIGEGIDEIVGEAPQATRSEAPEETGLAPLDGVSLVTAPYGAGGQVLGVLGVIGPTRMAYERVIPVVQATADALGEALRPPGPGTHVPA